jgi:hypothetical protein
MWDDGAAELARGNTSANVAESEMAATVIMEK